MMRLNYKHSFVACCVGYIIQAIVNNLMPLMFATFATVYGISLDKIGLLITVNFVVQLTVDFATAKFSHKFSYRTLIISAHVAATLGLVLMSMASVFSSHNIYPWLMLSVVAYGIGGGLIEVILSPMVEAMPMQNKAGVMNVLHSFYCWGQVLVTVLSTLFFVFVGIDKWVYLPIMWAVIPFVNGIAFLKLPVYQFGEEHQKPKMKSVFKDRTFWLFAVLMLGTGASELAMSQWSSYFTEMGLGVSKTVGDLLGPCMFALLMGVSRLFYSRNSRRIDLKRYITFCSVMCIFCYALATLSPYPMVSIAGCALCGFSVGVMWPGVYSLAAKTYAKGGTMIFALMALAGDIGCSTGPSIVGFVSNALGGTEAAIKIGLLSMVIFPITMVIVIQKLKGTVQ